MPVLNHHILGVRDAEETAQFWGELLGYEPPGRFDIFVTLQVSPDTLILFLGTDRELRSEHYAFLVDDNEFEQILGRVRDRGLTFWSDPGRTEAGQINHRDHGRGVYFDDPNGHLLELMTKPHRIEPTSRP